MSRHKFQFDLEVSFADEPGEFDPDGLAERVRESLLRRLEKLCGEEVEIKLKQKTP